MAATKHDALVEVVDLITRHGLTLDEVADAIGGGAGFRTARSGGILSRIFAYLGGIFVFAGLAIFVAMRWDELGPAGRVIATLGPGICLFVLALVCTTDSRVERGATPLFLIAAAVQPTGILVMLNEYGGGGDPRHAVLFMSLVMLVQQGCTFWARPRTVLAFTTVVFGSALVFVAFDLLDAHPNLAGMTMGVSLVCVGWSLDRSPYRAVAGLVYFVGAALLLEEAYSWMRREPVEVLFLGLATGIVVLATAARSRSLLIVGTAATIGYIGDFIYQHFADNLGAPLALMAIGFVLLGLGAAAVRINAQYIARERPAEGGRLKTAAGEAEPRRPAKM